MKLLSWGHGPAPRPDGWHTSDIAVWNGQHHVGPIQSGLPWRPGTFDAVVTNHALQMLPHLELLDALRELGRVLRPGGTLRVIVPDLRKAMAAFFAQDVAHFSVADSISPSLDGKLCAYLSQLGATRSFFTQEHLTYLLAHTGYVGIVPALYQLTRHGPSEITALDSRAHESLFMEAQKP